MTLTITFGYWLVPTVFTIGCYCLAFFLTEYDKSPSGFLDGLALVVMLTAATIASLIVWIVYLVACLAMA